MAERIFNKGTELGLSRRGSSDTVANPARSELFPVQLFQPQPDLVRANTAVRRLVKNVQTLHRTTDSQARRKAAEEMLSRTAEIASALENTRLGMVAVLAKVLSKLLAASSRNSDAINLCTLRSITRAIDLISGTLPKSKVTLPDGVAYRVLVVDDDLVCRRALSMSLCVEQLEIEVCGSGSAALDILRDQKFDAVFTDIMMPDLDGFGMVKKMRTLPHHCCTPVVYVTALSDYQTRVASVLSGGCELIVKPFNPSEMVVKALTTCLQERLENNHPKDERCQELRPGIPVMV
jgi:PleD family two-component response regulator